MRRSIVKNSLSVITAATVQTILDQFPYELYEIVKNSYILHEQGGCIKAPSSFLLFPHQPESRIIALPATVKPHQEKFDAVSGIKWISSYPNNKAYNLPRASAVIILNHPDTGFPIACIEGSLVSATRTAFSAIVGAEYLYNKGKFCKSLGIVGTGFIAKHIIKYLLLLDWDIEEIHLYDTLTSSIEKFQGYLNSIGDFKLILHSDTATLIRSTELIVFSTTEKVPYISDSKLFIHKPCVLHISLRDISPEVILGSHNVVDDVELILTADTSVHLAYKENQESSAFINSTIGQCILHGQQLDNNTVIYSPMGLGILDLTVSQFIYNFAKNQNLCQEIEGFFPI